MVERIRNYSGESYSDDGGHQLRTEHWEEVKKLERWFRGAGSDFLREMDPMQVLIQLHNDRRAVRIMSTDSNNSR